MLKNLTVSFRLKALVALVSSLAIVLATLGLYGMSSAIASFHFVNTDHLVHLRDLKVITDMYSLNVIDMAHKVEDNIYTWEQGRKKLAQARQTVREKWEAHPVDDLVGEERKLVDGIVQSFARIDVELDALQVILDKEDKAALAQFTSQRLYPAIDPIMGQLTEFIEAQLTEANSEYERAQSNYESNRNLAIGLIVVGLLLAAWLAWMIIRSVTGQLNLVQKVAGSIESTGDFSRRIEVQSSDEVGRAAAAINRMLQAQQAAVGEVNRVVEGLSQGRLDLRIEADLRGDLATMKEAVNRSAASIQATIHSINQVTAALQRGDFSAQVSLNAQGEYLQTLTQASQAMQMLSQMLGDIGQVMRQVSRGDLTHRVQAQGEGDLAALKGHINVSLDSLSQAMATIHGNTRQVAAAAGDTSKAVGQISDGAQNQTFAIGQLAAAVRQTTDAVGDVSRNTAATSQKSQESMAIMREGMRSMEVMVEVVGNIAANSEKINKITEVIEKIANKTNLLSLNAAIEAARAGEHGKGFSVVAEEVGKLATNSAESSQEIARLVQEAVVEAERAVRTVRAVNEGMRQIEQGGRDTDDMLRRIAATLEQQSAAVEEINASLTNLDAIARSNAAASEEMTATAIELSKIADATRREVDRFAIA